MWQEMNGGWCGFHGGPFPVLLWVAAIFLLVFVLRRIFPKKSRRWKDGGAEPLEVLKMRLARGEISAEEYEKLKSMLKD